MENKYLSRMFVFYFIGNSIISNNNEYKNIDNIINYVFLYISQAFEIGKK